MESKIILIFLVLFVIFFVNVFIFKIVKFLIYSNVELVGEVNVIRVNERKKI